MTTQKISIYFKTGLKLNERGFGLLDDLLYLSARKDDTREQLIERVGRTFNLEGKTLARFIERNLDLDAI